MAPKDKVLQQGLAAGMSATEGIHSKEPTWVDPAVDGIAALIPEPWIPTRETKVLLRGPHDNIPAPCVNIGAWSWGDKATWHWSPDQWPGVQKAWDILRNNGLNWIDTGQAYGDGESERLCGQLFKGLDRNEFIIQTKWYVVPDNATNLFQPSKSPAKLLQVSLKNMGLKYVDVYLVHGPIHPASISQAAQGMAECVSLGLTKTVGVANYSQDDMIQMSDELAKFGIPLAANQCEFSVLRRWPELHGLIKACRDRGIIFQSYSSLAQARLTGKYTPENPPPKTYRFSSYDMRDLVPTQDVLKEIAFERGVSQASVAINYNLLKGATPTVGIRDPKHAEDLVGALGWRLTLREVERIDAVSMEGKTTVLWQHA